MRVAVISAEAVPYSKTGGLGDVAGALPKALKKVGIDSVLITPCYLQTKGEYLWSTAIDDLWVDWRGGSYHAKAFYSEANGSPTFLICSSAAGVMRTWNASNAGRSASTWSKLFGCWPCT